MHSFIIISRPLCDIGRRQHDLYLGACNLLHLNGQDLRDLAVEERREILHGLIPAGSRIQSSEEILGDGDAVFYLVDKAGIEGIFQSAAAANITVSGVIPAKNRWKAGSSRKPNDLSSVCRGSRHL